MGGKRSRVSDVFSSTHSDGSDGSDIFDASENETKNEKVNQLHGLESGSDSEMDGAYSSEDEDRGRTQAVKKKVRVYEEYEEENEEEGEENEEEKFGQDNDLTETNKHEHENDNDNENEASNPHTVQSITPEQLEKDLKKLKKSGVVYIARIPPYMKPTKMRQILSRFGEVNRLYLAPEDAKIQARRKKYGGNKKKNYTEGWAEFVRKKDAKLAAETLNGNTIGGRKGSYYHDDILSVKYLPKFKWNNLTEQIALEAQARKEKLRAEISQATRENKLFIENVERKKMIDNIQKKKAETGKDIQEEAVRREFVQRATSTTRTTAKQKASKSVDPTSAKVSSVLSKVL